MTEKYYGFLFKARMMEALLNTNWTTTPPSPINIVRPCKWQTRRLMTPQPTNIGDATWQHSPRGKPGDIWYAKESLFTSYDVAPVKGRIVGVRIEQLQDISEFDAKAEGVGECESPRAAFAELWDGIYKLFGWTLNPWVWVYTLGSGEGDRDSKRRGW